MTLPPGFNIIIMSRQSYIKSIGRYIVSINQTVVDGKGDAE